MKPERYLRGHLQSPANYVDSETGARIGKDVAKWRTPKDEEVNE
ncbi:hypothetical protein ACFY04_05685 [Streptomyces sp. NPDC001549]